MGRLAELRGEEISELVRTLGSVFHRPAVLREAGVRQRVAVSGQRVRRRSQRRKGERTRRVDQPVDEDHQAPVPGVREEQRVERA